MRKNIVWFVVATHTYFGHDGHAYVGDPTPRIIYSGTENECKDELSRLEHVKRTAARVPRDQQTYHTKLVLSTTHKLATGDLRKFTVL